MGRMPARGGGKAFRGFCYSRPYAYLRRKSLIEPNNPAPRSSIVEGSGVAWVVCSVAIRSSGVF
jgi:hypothetical protein